MKTYKRFISENESGTGSNADSDSGDAVDSNDIVDAIKKETEKETDKKDDNVVTPLPSSVQTLFTGVIQNIDEENDVLELVSVYLTSTTLRVVKKFYNRLFVKFEKKDKRFKNIIVDKFFEDAEISIKFSGINTFEWIKDIIIIIAIATTQI